MYSWGFNEKGVWNKQGFGNLFLNLISDGESCIIITEPRICIKKFNIEVKYFSCTINPQMERSPVSKSYNMLNVSFVDG